MNEEKKPLDSNDANRDPITGEPGAHPVGTGVGAAGAGTIGAVIGGVVGGPVGAVVGSAVGAVVGGLAGKSAAEKINPTVEDEYWRENYAQRPYVEPEHQYEDYQPAYRTGYEAYERHSATGKTYDEVEPELQAEYEKNRPSTGLGWEKAKNATRDAWHKAEQSLKLYEERLVTDKNRVKTGEVAIGKHIETETVQVAIPIERERVVIESNSPSGAGSAIAPGEVPFNDQGQVARVEVYEETPDIQKQAFVREEVQVKKVVEQETVTATEQLRREELEVTTEKQPGTHRPDQV